MTTISDERILQRMIAVNPVTGQQSQIQLVQMPTSGVPSSQPQQILITTQPIGNEQDENRRLAFTEYFVEPSQHQTVITTNSIYQQPSQPSNAK